MRDFNRAGMSRILLFLLLGSMVAAESAAASISMQLTTAEKLQLQREARLVVDLLQNHHYSGRAFREMEGKAMIARFLEELDPQAEFLEADEVEFLHRRFDRTFKSVYLFRGDLQPAFEMFDLFISRAQERLAWVQQRLDRDFDFTLPETYAGREKPVPFKTRQEADRHWELLLKEHTLIERLRGRTPDEATAEVKRRFARAERTITAYDSLAVRERFFDGIIRTFDPHSGYFSADSAREFAVQMEKAVVGLGLELRKEEGRCEVAAVQLGGSADLNSPICPGDRIEALGEADGPWVETAGLRLREIVTLMRGPAGTKLRVAYRRGEEPARREAVLERTRVILGSDRAHGAVSLLPNPAGARAIGWINLPSFYTAGENGGLTSAARDVRELLEQMTKSRLDGLVIDLRDNPGGAVNEAVALSEIFLPQGVMMLSRGTDGVVKEHPLKPAAPPYAGPLVVLISASSASASEVFAGAMKYHRRALVVGAPATFGKGTVQAYMELAKMQGGDVKDWGTLRLTMQRFFLPDGGSVQRTGIPAHIVFPDFEPDAREKREADLPGALPAESVPAPAGLTPAAITGAIVTEPLLARLGGVATQDFTDLPEWTLIRDGQKLWAYDKPGTERSLLLEGRRKEWLEHEAANHAFWKKGQALITQTAYPTTPCEIGAVQETLAAQDARLRKPGSDGQTLRHRLHQGSLVVETEGGRLRQVRLESLDFRKYILEAEVLATRFSRTAGHPATAAVIGDFLRRADLLEHPTEQALVQAAGPLAGADATPEHTHRMLELLLGEIVELDGSLRRERAALDVPLRESLRLAAAWADQLTPVPNP